MGQGPEGSPDHRHPESVLTQHRMVVAESFLREDAATEDRDYSFLYQLTHITRDRGALTHDDRVDAVAGSVAHFQRAMMTWRGMRINGERVPVWSSRHGWSGMQG